MSVQVGELYTTLGMDDSGFRQSMDQAEGRSSNIMSVLKVGVAGAAAAAGAALVGMAKTGAENVAAIEDATRRFQSETGAAEEEAERFSDTIQDLHKVNTDSYEEIADAVTTLRQRHGELGDDAEEVTQQFMDFAKVTGQDNAQAIDDVTDMMHAWGMEIDDSGEAMDVLMAVSQDTGADVEALQGTLAETAPVMDALGMEFEEGAAMLGHFEERGVGAETASRGLRNAMSRLEDPTDSQREALEDLGVEFDDTGEVMGGTEEGLERIMERMSEGELSSKEMDAALDILGRRAGTDMVRALEDGEEGIEELMGTVEDSEGTVEEASEQYDKQLGERWQLIRRQYLEPFMETIGEHLIGVLESLLDFAEEWGPKVSEVFETVTAFISGLFGDMETDSDNTFSSILANITDIIGSIIDIIMVFVDRATQLWDEYGEDILAIWSVLWDTVWTVLDGIFETLGGLLDVFAGIFTGDWERMKEGLLSIWSGLWTAVEGVLEGAWDTVNILFERLREDLSEIWQGLWDGLENMVKGPINAIIGFINTLISAFESMVNSIARAINNIPSFDIPSWVPGIGGSSFGLPDISTVSLDTIPKLHDGGEFRAPAPGGEGLAKLMDGEVVTPSGEAGNTTINITGNNFRHRSDIDYMVRKLKQAKI